jgi:pimeloyl-ACP methyl ester carboxylesterase
MKCDVKLPAGARVAYAYTGGKTFDPMQPCIVFLHGALADHSVWTLAARWFAHHGHAVIAPDLPGHSRSLGPPLASAEALADWLIALLDAAHVGRAALVGHSMGSLIALEAAARAPDRVAQLVMVGTAYPMKVSAALLDSARVDPLAAIDTSTPSRATTPPAYQAPASGCTAPPG